MSIVSTNIKYNFNILKSNIISLSNAFDFLNVSTIGYSVSGNNIYCLKLGKGPNEVFYSASIHANEWITSIVLMKFIEDFCNSYIQNKKIYNYSATDIFNNSTIYIFPMVNPDGVNLVTGSYSIKDWQYDLAKSFANNYPDIKFPEGWKANIRGVDFKYLQLYWIVYCFLFLDLDYKTYLFSNSYINFSLTYQLTLQYTYFS